MDGKKVIRLWEQFATSHDGRELLAGNAQGIYLRNRVELAFLAGIEAAERAFLFDTETSSQVTEEKP